MIDTMQQVIELKSGMIDGLCPVSAFDLIDSLEAVIAERDKAIANCVELAAVARLALRESFE